MQHMSPSPGRAKESIAITSTKEGMAVTSAEESMVVVSTRVWGINFITSAIVSLGAASRIGILLISRFTRRALGLAGRGTREGSVLARGAHRVCNAPVRDRANWRAGVETIRRQINAPTKSPITNRSTTYKHSQLRQRPTMADPITNYTNFTRQKQSCKQKQKQKQDPPKEILAIYTLIQTGDAALILIQP